MDVMSISSKKSLQFDPKADFVQEGITGTIGKVFNVNADCHPDLHYMVDLRNRLVKIKK